MLGARRSSTPALAGALDDVVSVDEIARSTSPTRASTTTRPARLGAPIGEIDVRLGARVGRGRRPAPRDGRVALGGAPRRAAGVRLRGGDPATCADLGGLRRRAAARLTPTARPISSALTRHGQPRRHRVHLHVDRPDLPAEPRRARRLQRGEVRRRLLADARAGPAPQARLHRRADRHRAGAAAARSRLRLGGAAELRARPRRRRASGSRSPRRRSPRAGATASTSTSRTRAPSTATPTAPFDAVASLGAFEHFCSPEEYRAGRQEEIYARPVRERRERAAGRRALLPADDGLRAQHDPVRGGQRATPRATPTRSSCSCSAASSPARGCRSGSTSSCAARRRTSAWSRARAAGSTTSRRSRSGTSGSARRACARTSLKLTPAAALAAQPDVPPRVHLGRQRQQGLLRARAARPLSGSCSRRSRTTAKAVRGRAAPTHARVPLNVERGKRPARASPEIESPSTVAVNVTVSASGRVMSTFQVAVSPSTLPS